MLDNETKKAIQNIITNSEKSAAEAFCQFREAVNQDLMDREKIERLYNAWRMYDDYFSTESTMLEMLIDGVGFEN